MGLGFESSVDHSIQEINIRLHAAQQLHESEERYRLLFEHASEAFLILRDGVFIECNEAALRLFGAEREQLLGAHPWQFSPLRQPNGIDSRTLAQQKINAALRGSFQVFDWTHCRLDGAVRYTEVRLNPITLRGETLLQVLIQDVTERKQAEEEVRRISRLYAVLSQVNQAIVRIHSEEELFAQICRVAVEFGGFPLAWIGSFDPQERHLVTRCSAGPGMPYLEEVMTFEGDQTNGCCPAEVAFRENCAVVANTLEDGPRAQSWQAAARRNGFTAAAAFPLTCGDGVSAVLALYSSRAGFFNEDEMRLLAEVAEDISFALNRFAGERMRQQAEEELRKSEARYRALIELNPDTIFVQVDRRFAFINHAGLDLFGLEQPEQLLGQEILEHIHPNHRAQAARRIQQLNEERFAVPRVEEAFLRADGSSVDTEVEAVPIEFGGKNGALVLARDITVRKQAEWEIQRRLLEMDVLHRVALSGTAASSLDELIAQVTGIVHEQLYPTGFGVALLDEGLGRLVYHPSSRMPAAITGAQAGVAAGICEMVMRCEMPQRVGDADDGGMRSQVCVPLIIGEDIIGIIHVTSPVKNAFRLADEQFLVVLAGELCTAIEKIHLHEQTRHQVRRLTALRAIDQAILTHHSLEKTLEVLLEQVTSQLGVDAASLLLYDPLSGYLEPVAGRGWRTGLLESGLRLRLGESHGGRVALERKMEFIPNLIEIGDELAAYLERMGEHFTSYVAVPLIAKDEVKGVLEFFHRTEIQPSADWLEFTQTLGNQAAIAVDNAQLFHQLLCVNQDLQMAYDDTITGWSRALDLRDKETEGHSRRVTELTLTLAQAMGVPETEIPDIRRGAQLHDIGKMGIPDGILLKPGALSPEEWAIMRKHTVFARDLLLPVEYLRPALDIPYSHHEKWDGSGYPQGLKGEQIPLAARIFAVVDVWDAITTDRPYRYALSREQALVYIREQSGKHFDPRVVAAFLEIVSGRD